MKIVAINGSPRGKDGNTHVMVNAFLKGAQEAGAETIYIFLAEKEVRHCQACYTCIINTPGQCAIKDDMAEILSLEEGADLLVLATPLQFDNMSSLLKAYMDRKMALVDPHFRKDSNGESRHVNKDNAGSPFRLGATPPKLAIISSCGYSEHSHFQALSLWLKRVALNMLTEISGEIYATQGFYLNPPAGVLQSVAANFPQLPANIAGYLQLLEEAGREIAINGKLSEATNKELAEQQFLPADICLQIANAFADSVS